MRIPTATYRLQLGRRFRLADAAAIVPYLDELGISDAYLSPILQARSGSAHGYDVTDPTRVSEDLGGEAALADLADALRRRDMGLLLDIVPNHAAVSHQNPWLRDVLRHGRASSLARCFDIDWRPPRRDLAGRLLLPILAEPYANTLAAGWLSLALEPEGLRVCYGTWRLPVRTGDYRRVIGADLPGLADLVERLARWRGGDPEAVERMEAEVWRRCAEDAGIGRRVEARLRRFAGPGGAGRLDRLLARQPYRLGYWATTHREVNFRRFFAVNELIGLRVEDEVVFERTHGTILRLVAAGWVTGLRVDHVDGLADPAAYLDRLTGRAGVYTVVEKILAAGEALPEDWPAQGTTGYDFLNAVNGLFVDPAGVERLADAYGEICGRMDPFPTLIRAQKRLAMSRLFSAELRRLTHALGGLAARDPLARDLTLDELEQALVEVTAALQVYRTYVPPVGPRDRAVIERAVAGAAGRAGEAALRFLGRVLLIERPLGSWRRFARRWQQFTGAVTAKGVEDRSFYLHAPLLSLNEVGGEPGSPPLSVPEFHAFLAGRRARWPHAMNTTATHDTKRGEDARLRIDMLSQVPQLWRAAVGRWRERNRVHAVHVHGEALPEAAMEWLLYQTLLGCWPAAGGPDATLAARLRGYAVKAAREAGARTSWLEPHGPYEAALVTFAERLLGDGGFLADFTAVWRPIAFFAALASLSQVVLRVAAPGVPDLYQGGELWDLDLVDPDNRRPVDFALRREWLREIDGRAAAGGSRLAAELLGSWQDGRVKLFVTACALRLRRRHAAVFLDGDYLPAQVCGARAAHVCAFLRTHDRGWVLAAVPRLLLGRLSTGDALPSARLPEPDALWADTRVLLPDGAPRRWRDAFTGAVLDAAPRGPRPALPAAALFRDLPFALAVGA